MNFGDHDEADDNAADVATADGDDDADVSWKCEVPLVATAMKDSEAKKERSPQGGPLHNAAGRDT